MLHIVTSPSFGTTFQLCQFKTCMHNSHNKNLAIPESHLDDDNVDSEVLVSLLTLLFVFEESSPLLDLVSEMKITLKLKEMVWIKFPSD